jgi:hypothetical protein
LTPELRAQARTAAGGGTATAGTTGPWGTARTPGSASVWGEGIAQLGGVRVTDVDLVRRTVEGEGDRLGAGCVVAVNVAGQQYLNALSHGEGPSPLVNAERHFRDECLPPT